MSHIISKNQLKLDNIQQLSFLVLAPESQLKHEKSFQEYTNLDYILKNVGERVRSYEGRKDYQDKDTWFNNCFKPFSQKVKVRLISWEQIIDIMALDKEYFRKIQDFYDNCKKFNKKSNTF